MTRKATKQKIIHSLAEIPVFKTEDEERAWWDEHDLSVELYDSLPENTSSLPPIKETPVAAPPTKVS